MAGLKFKSKVGGVKSGPGNGRVLSARERQWEDEAESERSGDGDGEEEEVTVEPAPDVRPPVQTGGPVDVTKHVNTLTQAGIRNPDEPMLTVSFAIGERKFKQALDGLLSLKWDNARQRFDREEVVKRLGMCAIHSATYLTAATQAAAERERLENYFQVWFSEQSKVAEKTIMSQRLTEVTAKHRTQVGQITAAQIEAWILDRPDLKKQFLALKYKITDAKANEKMMRGLYETMQANGSYLQTLAKLYLTEDVAGR